MLIDIRITPPLLGKTNPPILHDKLSLVTALDTEFFCLLKGKLRGWRKNGAPTNQNKIVKQVLGYEIKNKFGEPTHAHFHYNVELEQHESIKKTESQMKASLQDFMRSQNYKGNAMYSIRINHDVNDEKRWFRYPMKQGNWISTGFTEAKLQIMESNAMDEYGHQVEKNLKSRERHLEKNQFRDKLWKHLDDNKITEARKIAKAIFHFYNENGRDAPIFALQEKVINYQIVRGLIDFNETFKYWK